MSKLIWYIYKTSYVLNKWKLRYLAFFFVLINRIVFGIFISPKAYIDKNVKFAYYGMSIVIGSGVIIEDRCEIGQNVTLGGRFSTTVIGGGYPHIESNSFIGPGSMVLGGITIGSNTIIGANSVVLKDCDANSIYVGNPVKKVRSINKRIIGDQYV